LSRPKPTRVAVPIEEEYMGVPDGSYILSVTYGIKYSTKSFIFSIKV